MDGFVQPMLQMEALEGLPSLEGLPLERLPLEGRRSSLERDRRGALARASMQHSGNLCNESEWRS
jgi:hypothetical protein